MHKSSYFRLLGPQIRAISTETALRQSNLYDSLGVSAKATQADIKSAYYKLSMVYHPDKNKDSEDAAKKFRDISQAYEVLGNVKSRKLYDRGMFMRGANDVTYHSEEPVNKFYKSRDTRSRPPAPQDRATVYNFDEWSRNHYQATFRKDMHFKARAKTRKKTTEELAEEIKSERMIAIVVVVFIFTSMMFVDVGKYDKVTAVGSSIVVTKRND